MSTSLEHINTLIANAAKAAKSEDAMRFSQAAVNVANALCAKQTAMERGEK